MKFFVLLVVLVGAAVAAENGICFSGVETFCEGPKKDASKCAHK